MAIRRRAQTDKVVFNGRDLSSLLICKVHRPLMSPIEAKFQAIGGRDGEAFRRSRLKGYDLELEVWLRAERARDVSGLRHRLAAALWTSEPAPLYLPDDPGMYLMAMVSGDTNLGAIMDAGADTDLPGTTIKFHIGDPIYYGRHRQAELSQGANGVAVGGTWESFPTITATPKEADAWRVTNRDTSDFVEVSSTTVGRGFDGKSELVIDMGLERVTYGGLDVAVTASSDFFAIGRRGESVRTTLDVTCNARMEWDERWL